MNQQTSFPVFESGQVLTSSHLNDAVEYLEQQDRLTRARLIGAGVMCGLQVDVDDLAQVHISGGVAVTTEGYLFTEADVVCDRARPYTPPVPDGEAEADEVEVARYPYLYLGGDEPIEAWELLAVGAPVVPGEAHLRLLDAAFLADKTVLLFLECDLQSLKSCDINDCADKGSEMRFTVRRLLVRRADAQAMLALEAKAADRPVDAAAHPRLELPYLRLEKLNPSGSRLVRFPQLLGRVLEIAARLAQHLPKALRGAYDACAYLLRDMFPESRFPDGPFPSSYFANVIAQVVRSPVLIQHFYDYLLDVVRAYDEFVAAAMRFDAQCQPQAARFPKHVLLGDATVKPRAFGVDLSPPADVDAYDPAAASTGFGPSPRPAARRHAWIPSPAHGDGGAALEELRSLFYRLTLLAHCYDTRELLLAPVRVTPSRDGAAPLGERALPFYYAADRDSDLFRNWSYEKTRTNRLATIYGYHLNPPDADHPLWFRLDEQDFYRVEGLVGKPLGSTMATLVEWKRAQSLDFGIEPVWMPLGVGDDEDDAVDQQSRERAFEAVRRLLLCRMSDLDVIFLMLMTAIIAFLVWLIRRLAGQDARIAAAGPARMRIVDADADADAQAKEAAFVGDAGPGLFSEAFVARIRPISMDAAEEESVRLETDRLVDDYRQGSLARGEVTARLVGDAGSTSVAGIYAAVKESAAGGELYDRTQAHVASLGADDVEAATRSAYAGVALLDRAEQLMEVAAAPSVADFDVDAFGTAYRGFADAYTNYARVAVVDEQAVGVQAAASNAQLQANVGVVSANAQVLSAANIMREIRKRLLNLFADLTLAGYAQRHPGLEHRCGVPQGGTLVLVYGSARELEALLAKSMSKASKGVAAAAQPLQSPQDAFAVGAAAAAGEVEQAAARRTADPLDDFVIFADFCLPHQCCDSDCSDIEVQKRFGVGVFDDVRPGSMRVDPLIPGDGKAGDLGQKPPRPRPEPLPADDLEAAPAPRERARMDLADRPVRRRAAPQAETKTGVVVATVYLVESHTSRRPLPEARVLVIAPDGTRRTYNTDERARVRVELPAGTYGMRGQLPDHRGTTAVVEVTAGGRRLIDLRMVEAG